MHGSVASRRVGAGPRWLPRSSRAWLARSRSRELRVVAALIRRPRSFGPTTNCRWRVGCATLYRGGVADALPQLVGINHVALEVGDIDEALAFYGRIFEISLRGRMAGAAFIDIGDQFIALMEGRSQPPDRARHFGLVVDDKEATRRALETAGAEIVPGRGLDFRDPWGNNVQVVQYDEVQFTKTGRRTARDGS